MIFYFEGQNKEINYCALLWTFFLLLKDVLSGCAIVLLTLGKLNTEIPKVNKCVHKSEIFYINFSMHKRSPLQSRQSAKKNSPMNNHPTQEISVNITKVQHMLAFQSAQYRYNLYIYILKLSKVYSVYFQILTFAIWDINNTRWFSVYFIAQTITCFVRIYTYRALSSSASLQEWQIPC